MQVTLEPIRHTYYSTTKDANIENNEQILMREGGSLGYPISIFHIDLFWKDGYKGIDGIYERLNKGETLTVEMDFKVVRE